MSDEQRARDAFCLTRCRGACCFLRHPDGTSTRCPNLTEEGSCGIYHTRYAPGTPDVMLVGWYRREPGGNLHPFYCGRIEQMLEKGEVHPEVRQGCCYWRPELLTINQRKEGA